MTKFAILWMISATGGISHAGNVPLAVFASIGDCDREYRRISKQSDHLASRLICVNSSKLYFSLPIQMSR